MNNKTMNYVKLLAAVNGYSEMALRQIFRSVQKGRGMKCKGRGNGQRVLVALGGTGPT